MLLKINISNNVLNPHVFPFHGVCTVREHITNGLGNPVLLVMIHFSTTCHDNCIVGRIQPITILPILNRLGSVNFFFFHIGKPRLTGEHSDGLPLFHRSSE